MWIKQDVPKHEQIVLTKLKNNKQQTIYIVAQYFTDEGNSYWFADPYDDSYEMDEPDAWMEIPA